MRPSRPFQLTLWTAPGAAGGGGPPPSTAPPPPPPPPPPAPGRPDRGRHVVALAVAAEEYDLLRRGQARAQDLERAAGLRPLAGGAAAHAGHPFDLRGGDEEPAAPGGLRRGARCHGAQAEHDR